jgi:tRNA1Val (adenine37-N6)-methyltransferase
MANSFFQFKQFTIHQDRCAMKVTTDACLFGAWATKEVMSSESVARQVLDVGSGTGLLSLMLAQKTNNSVTIDSIEIDAAAATQAQSNAAASPWKERIFVIPGDAKDMARTPGKKYDAIISNPPFYGNELTSPDHQKNLAHHHSGLLLEELLQIISNNLAPDGHFYLLLPYKRILETGFVLQKYHLEITHATLVRQSTQHDHFRLFIAGKHAGNSEEIYIKDEIAICNDKQEYTKEFIELLKDYYLYL